MSQRASPSPANPDNECAASTTTGTNRAGAEKSVQFESSRIETDVTAAVRSPSARGPHTTDRSRRRRRRTSKRHQDHRFSCFYASGSPYYSLCRDIIQNCTQDDAMLSVSQSRLVELGVLDEEILKRGLYLGIVARIDTAQMAREQAEHNTLPPAVFSAQSDDRRDNATPIPVAAAESSLLGEAPSSPFRAWPRLCPLHEDLTKRQMLGHLAYLKRVPLLDMEMAARLSAMKIVTTFVRSQFEYVVEPLLQDIAHDLLDGQVLDRAHNEPKSEAKPPLGPAGTAKSLMEADTSAQDERIAVRVDWSRITDEIQAVAVGSWGRADVTRAEPFGDDDLTSTWEEDVSTQTSTAALRPAQATQVVEAVLGALKRTVGRVSWQRLMRAVLGYGLTTSSEWDIVLRYSLILRLRRTRSGTPSNGAEEKARGRCQRRGQQCDVARR